MFKKLLKIILIFIATFNISCAKKDAVTGEVENIEPSAAKRAEAAAAKGGGIFGDINNAKKGSTTFDFATSNGMFVRGHTLLWSNRNPYWLFWDEKGNLVHRKLLDQRLKEHIHAVVSRYRGKVYAWDVVNEAIYDNDKEFLKPNGWYKIMGAEYIKKAFMYTHEADSNAILFYNDYDAEQPDKLKRIVKLIKWLQSENVPIHGIGIQAHWTLDIPKISDLKAAIDAYSSLGLQVQLTELDITMPADFQGGEEEKMELL